jgi:ADP-ribose pyrophosphatase
MDPYSAAGDGRIIRRLRERLVYRNQFVSVYDDPVRFPDGDEGSYLRIIESGGNASVAMLPICDGKIALVLTYRYPQASWEWGVPRGFAHGSDPVESAKAELTEELGREPDSLSPIGAITPNSGLLAGRTEMFAAWYGSPADQPADCREVAAVRWISPATLLNEITGGRITDAFTLSTFTCARARGLI